MFYVCTMKKEVAPTDHHYQYLQSDHGPFYKTYNPFSVLHNVKQGEYEATFLNPVLIREKCIQVLSLSRKAEVFFFPD